VLAGALVDEESLADGVALLSLEDPIELGVELEPVVALDGAELDPVLEDDESLGLVLELEPEPFVASSRRQSSFAAPVIASQRGEAPYELGDEELAPEEESLDVPDVDDCANTAAGKASATAMTASFCFMEISCGWLLHPHRATPVPERSPQESALH